MNTFMKKIEIIYHLVHREQNIKRMRSLSKIFDHTIKNSIKKLKIPLKNYETQTKKITQLNHFDV